MLMTIQFIKAYTINYIWLIITNEDNFLFTLKDSYQIQKI